MRLGYACINTVLRKDGIHTSRKMIKRTFQAKGIEYASELAVKNIKDLIEIIKWNHKNGCKLYRMSSNIFPWQSEYEYSDLPDFDKIKALLKGAGTLAKKYDQRLSFHPGPFTILASPKPGVVEKAIKELNQHSQIMDMMGLPVSNYAKINIHTGGTYGDKMSTMKRFCDNFKLLNANTQARLVVENDDRPSMYTVSDLMFIHEQVGIPITFDYHHHMLNTGDMSEKDAFLLATSTWPKGITPTVHYSSSKKLYEDESSKAVAHADWIYNEIDTYGVDVDIMCECKAKEQAIIKYSQSSLQNTLDSELYLLY